MHCFLSVVGHFVSRGSTVVA